MSDWVEPLVATFGVPLIFMTGDYILRLKGGLATKDELTHQVGSDCCILSLGAVGAVYIDPHVHNVKGISSQLTLVIVVGALSILRYLCLPSQKNVRPHDPKLSMFLGFMSMFIVSTILVIGAIYGAKP